MSYPCSPSSPMFPSSPGPSFGAYGFPLPTSQTALILPTKKSNDNTNTNQNQFNFSSISDTLVEEVNTPGTDLNSIADELDLDVKVEDANIDDEDEANDGQPPKKKRQPWGRKLTPPTTNLPPRKRAKTDAEKEQRKYERIIRNRKAAETSRKRKQEEQEKLNQEVGKLRATQDQLRADILARDSVIQDYRLLLTQYKEVIEKETGSQISLPWEDLTNDKTTQALTLSLNEASPLEVNNYVSPSQLEHESPMAIEENEDWSILEPSISDMPPFADSPASDGSNEYDDTFPQTPDGGPVVELADLENLNFGADLMKSNFSLPQEPSIPAVDFVATKSGDDNDTFFSTVYESLMEDRFFNFDSGPSLTM